MLGITAPLVWRQGAAEPNNTAEGGASRPVDEALAIQETLLQARVRSLRAVLAESASRSAEPIPTKARSAESHGPDDKSLPLASGPRAEKPTPTETTLRKIAEVASITGEPVERLYRLAAARRLEEVDRSLASARYREIVEESRGAAPRPSRARASNP